MLDEEDVQVMGIQFDGDIDPLVGMYVHPQLYPYQQVGSLQEVIDSDGETWWQPTTGYG